MKTAGGEAVAPLRRRRNFLRSDAIPDHSGPYFGGESQEQMLKELHVRVERFYERATREQIQEATRVVESLLAARGLLPEQASKKIN